MFLKTPLFCCLVIFTRALTLFGCKAGDAGFAAVPINSSALFSLVPGRASSHFSISFALKREKYRFIGESDAVKLHATAKCTLFVYREVLEIHSQCVIHQGKRDLPLLLLLGVAVVLAVALAVAEAAILIVAVVVAAAAVVKVVVVVAVVIVVVIVAVAVVKVILVVAVAVVVEVAVVVVVAVATVVAIVVAVVN